MNKKGFTLMEVLASVTILAIISGIALVSYSSYQQKIRTKELTTLRETVISSFNNKRIDDPTLYETSISNLSLNNNISYNGKKCSITSGNILVRSKKDVDSSYLSSLLDNYQGFPKEEIINSILNNEKEVYCLTFYCDDNLIINDYNSSVSDTIKVNGINYTINEINYCK